MEGLRISLLLLCSFLAGITTRAVLSGGGVQEHPEKTHAVAGPSCPPCDAQTPATFYFSR